MFTQEYNLIHEESVLTTVPTETMSGIDSIITAHLNTASILKLGISAFGPIDCTSSSPS